MKKVGARTSRERDGGVCRRQCDRNRHATNDNIHRMKFREHFITQRSVGCVAAGNASDRLNRITFCTHSPTASMASKSLETDS